MGQIPSSIRMPESVIKDDIGDVQPFLDIKHVPDEVIEYARVRLGETPDKRTELLEDLREMIYQRGDVQPIRMDDEYLLRFLRARNFKLEATYRLLQNYQTFREENPCWWDVCPLDFYYIGDADIVNVLPYREQNGRRIIILKIGKWDPSTTSVDDLFKAVVATLEVGILEPRAQILGGIAIFDMEGLTMNHAWHMTPSIVHKVIQVTVTSLPYKIAAIHIVNESWIFEKIFSMFKPFLTKRYSDILFFHGSDRKSLHQHIEPKYLPEVYGGIRPEYGCADWFRYLASDQSIVREMTSIGYKSSEEENEE
ncbi:alpha-tocopherol transfer protein isoform X1 [Halyomorpha halys]|uniref:alpha-tocopherol transfer protein isoform X1 n=2 Tax=Halyomorpha halys TaxID=286706 RepID=UPI0006D4D942|nr:alpha-tocopherol transfer protein isoform X2 [Halyomorpha halys]